MKRIDGTELWTDGVVKYKKNEQGNLAVYNEETIVESGEVELKPAPQEVRVDIKFDDE